MVKKIQLTEKDLHNLIIRIVEESENEYHHLTPEKYLNILELINFDGNNFKKLKKYKDKPLWIDGDLDVSGLDVKNLGPIAGISGKLNISRTKVSSIEGIDIKGYVSDYNSPRERIRERQEYMSKKSEMGIKREYDEWNIENQDEEGLKAMALLDYLEGEGKVTVLSDEQKQELKELTQQLEDLNARYDDIENRDGDPDENVEILNQIEEVQEQIDDLTRDVGDIYDMYPTNYTHYGLTQFEVLVDGFKGEEYSVGTEKEMDYAALAYAKNYIDDVGVEGFNESFVEDYLDVDTIVRMAEEDYDYQIRDYPESYFNDDDFELTPEQEKRIEELEFEIEQLESEIEEYEERLNDIDDSDSPEYTEIQEYIDTLEERKDSCQEELDSIEVDTEPTEEMIENKVEEYVRDVRRDPLNYLKEYGLPIKEYIDEDDLAQGLVNSDGWGVMNGYDGTYDSVNVAGKTYYIMRIN